MTDLCFVDTNVLVYARDDSEPEKQPKAFAWLQHLWERRRGRLSTQVLCEYYVTVTKKLTPGLEKEIARADLRNLHAWQPLAIQQPVIERAWDLQDQHQLSWWDALIMAAAHACGCRYLLSEDFTAGRDYGDVRVINPFRTSCDTLT